MKRLPGEKLRCTNIEATASHLSRLKQIDAGALGISRERHHRYLLNDSTMKGYLFHGGDDCIGYAYISANGHIGPLAVTQRDAMGAAFKTALNLAAGSGASQVSAFLPGTGDMALSIAAEHGMRITFPMVLVSTRDFGDWNSASPDAILASCDRSRAGSTCPANQKLLRDKGRYSQWCGREDSNLHGSPR